MCVSITHVTNHVPGGPPTLHILHLSFVWHPFQVLGVSTNELKQVCLIKEIWKTWVLGGLQDRGWEPLLFMDKESTLHKWKYYAFGHLTSLQTQYDFQKKAGSDWTLVSKPISYIWPENIWARTECEVVCGAARALDAFELLLSACQEDGGFLGGMKICRVSNIYSERHTQGRIRSLSPPSWFLN